MPHVTFIHGISNKPPEADLQRIWLDAVAAGDTGVPLGDHGVTSSVVYWADLLYAEPDTNLEAYEVAYETIPEGIDAGGDAEAPVPHSEEEARFLAGLRAKTAGAALAAPDLGLVVNPDPVALERIPIPWLLKKRFMDIYLRDVHHYLFNVEFGLPGKSPVRVQDVIRKRFTDTLMSRSTGDDGKHVVVSHSLGTVIAYDCLKRVGDCANVDGLITLGSPLGIDEVQDRLRPEWTRANGFPEKVTGGWINLFDRLDPVCGFDAKIENDFRRNDDPCVEDVAVENDGLWRHSATKYLRQPKFQAALIKLLAL